MPLKLAPPVGSLLLTYFRAHEPSDAAAQVHAYSVTTEERVKKKEEEKNSLGCAFSLHKQTERLKSRRRWCYLCLVRQLGCFLISMQDSVPEIRVITLVGLWRRCRRCWGRCSIRVRVWEATGLPNSIATTLPELRVLQDITQPKCIIA